MVKGSPEKGCFLSLYVCLFVWFFFSFSVDGSYHFALTFAGSCSSQLEPSQVLVKEKYTVSVDIMSRYFYSSTLVLVKCSLDLN